MNQHPTFGKTQRGATLFIALIALVIMTMGALAVFRSLDSATGVAGNVGFRQQGVAATDLAVQAAFNYLAGTPMATLDNDVGGSGYYASMDMYVLDREMLKFNWEANALEIGQQNGYRLWYVIHRMCEANGTPSTVPCVSAANSSTLEGGDIGIPKPFSGTVSRTPYFRISARALGPRQSESVVQVVVY